MASYLPNTSLTDTGNILYSPTSSSNAADAQTLGGKPHLIDTVAVAQQEEVSSSILPSARPALPTVKPKIAPNYMMQIADAFTKAYSSMSQSVITETLDYTSLQQLDQTQTQAIIQSSTDAINKQEAAEQEAAQIQAYQAKMSKIDSIFTWVTVAVGIVLIAATVASSIFDGGASLAAVPEEVEIEMDTLGTTVAENAVEDAGDSASSSADSIDDSGDSSSSSGSSSNASALQEGASDTTEDIAEEGQNTQNEVSKADAQTDESDSNWKQKMGKIAVKMGFAAAMGSPMLMKGIVGVEVSDKLKNLAIMQNMVGQAMATVSNNNLYFQFLQQLVQREGSVLSEEANDASQVIDTYSSVTAAVQGISYGLANAV